MNWDQATQIFRQIESAAPNRGDLGKFKRDFLNAAIVYARVRTDWQLADLERRQEMDARRTQAHNAFIDACNILSRQMAKQGLDISWHAALGSRKEIGDFACYIHSLLGLAAR